MSLKISDVLKLPCLQQATVIDGKEGLSEIVGAVSALEYTAADELQETLFNSVETLGGELVISCFAGIKDDIDAQCLTLRRLAAALMERYISLTSSTGNKC